MAGADTHDKSPEVWHLPYCYIRDELIVVQDLFFLGQTRFGIYKDDCEGVHPETIEQYYGVDGELRRNHTEAGAGHPADEQEADGQDIENTIGKIEGTFAHEDLAEQIANNQKPHVRHEGAPVPLHTNPFQHAEAESRFFGVLGEVVKNGIIPTGYGMLIDEWEDGIYPDVEYLRIGLHGKKEIQVSLAAPVWRRRAQLWVQGLSVLSHFSE